MARSTVVTEPVHDRDGVRLGRGCGASLSGSLPMVFCYVRFAIGGRRRTGLFLSRNNKKMLMKMQKTKEKHATGL